MYSAELEQFLFQYTEKYYMLICCTVKVLLARVYGSPLLYSKNVTDKLYGSSETTALSSIRCVCCMQLKRNVTEVLKPFKTFIETFSYYFIGRTGDLVVKICSLKEALETYRINFLMHV